jgi:hypothetical protein
MAIEIVDLPIENGDEYYYNISGWWFGTREFYVSPIILGIIHHPN